MSASRHVWVPDETDGFVLGEVKAEAGDELTVSVLGFDKTFPKEEVFEANSKRYSKVADMSQLGHLSDATVLHNLKERYFANSIYTYSGLFCVAINPYRMLPIYTPDVVEQYKGKRREEIEPHVFAVADEAYRAMMEGRRNQSMLITGESGAGKTVNTKKVIQYLAAIAGRISETGGRGELEEQIVQANPILEAFGNAKTIRNNNSSRFGKFIEIQFTGSGVIAGGVIDVYLLEKSRVVFQSGAERNYHIFYQLLVGAPQGVRDALNLTRCEDYRWLNPNSYDADGIDDTEWWAETQEAWEIMGVSEAEWMDVYRIMAAVLHMGNVTFTQTRRSDDAQLADDGASAAVAAVEGLLGLEAGALDRAVLRPRLKAGMEWVNKSRSAAQAQNVMEALAKSIYERTFKWIVTRINQTLHNKNKRELFIGVLDISGFEIFEVNSFEQLCINYTNEKLQQFFNHHMFNLEQEEYMREGIEWDMIDFGMDLQGTIDLIEQTKMPFGILSILDEQCAFPKATDETFVEKLGEMHADKHSKFSLPKFAKDKFVVGHYAGNVEYTADDWLEKNRDKLDDPIAVVLQDSSADFVSALFDDLYPDREGEASVSRSKKQKTRPYVSVAHKSQLFSLMDTLESTTPHFIRCIKPNEEKRPALIDAHMVLDQLRCNGVLEGIRICRKGFPNRLLFQDFKDRYRCLAGARVPDSMLDLKEACRIIVETVGVDPSQYRIGVSKVFFKAGRLPELEEMRDEILGKLLMKFQAVVRGHIGRSEFTTMLENSNAIAVLQKSVRSYLKLRNWGWWQLFAKIRPLIVHRDREAEERARQEEVARLQADKEAAAKKEAEMQAEMARIAAEKEAAAAEAAARAAAAEANAAAEAERLRSELAADKARMEAEADAAKAAAREEARRLKDQLAADRAAAEAASEDERKRLMDKMEATKREMEAAAAKETARVQAEAAAQAEELERKRLEYEQQLRKREQQLASSRAEAEEQEGAKRRLMAEKSGLIARIDGLEADLEEERNARNKADANVRALQSEIADLKARVGELEAEVASLEATKRSLETQLATAALEAQDAADAQARLEKAKRSASADADALQDEMEDLEKARAAADRAKRNAEKLLAENEAALAEANARREAAEKKARKLSSELKTAKASPASSGIGSTSDIEVKRMENELRALREQLVTAESKISSIERQKRSLQTANEDLTESLDESSRALADAKRKERAAAEAASVATEELEEEIADREAAELLLHQRDLELDDARRQLSAALDEKESSLSSTRSKWEQAVAELREELAGEVKAKAAVEKALRRAKTDLDDERAASALRASSGAESSAKERRLAADLARAKEALAEAQRAGAVAEANAAKLASQVNTFRDEADEALRASSVAAKKVKSLEMENEDLREQVEEEGVLHKAAVKHVKELEVELAEAVGRAEDEEAAAEMLRDEQTRLLEEIELLKSSADVELVAKIEELEKMVRDLRNEILELREELDEERRKTASAERAKRAIASELDAASDALESEKLRSTLLGEAKASAESEIKALRAQLSSEQESTLSAQLRMKKMDAAQAEIAAQMAELAARRDAEAKAKKELKLQIKELQEDVSEASLLTQHVERSKKLLSEEVQQLKEELEDALEERQKVEDLRRQQYAQLQEYRNSLENADSSRVTKLEEEKRSLQARLDELELRGLELERKASRAGAGEGSGRGARASIEAKTAVVEEQSKARSATKLAKKHKAEAAKVNSKLLKVQKELESAKRDAQAAKTQLADTKARLEVNERNSSALAASNAALQAQVEDLRDAHEVAVRAKTQQAAKRRELELAVQELQTAADGSRSGASAEALDELKRQHILEIAEIKKQHAADAAVEIEALEKSKRESRAKREALKELLDEAERDNASMEKQLQRAQREASAAVARLDDEVKSRTEFEKSNRTLMSENKDLAHRLSTAESFVEGAKGEIAVLRAAQAESLSKTEDLLRQVSSLDAAAKAAEAEIEAMKDDYDDAIAAAEEAAEQLAFVQAEADDLRDRLAAEEALREDWEADKLEVTDKLATLKEQYDTEIADHADAMEESRRALLTDVKVLSEKAESEERQKFELEKNNRRLANELEDAADELAALKRKQAEHDRITNKLSTDLTIASTKLEQETRLRAEADIKAKRAEMAGREAAEELADANRMLETARAKRRAIEDRLQAVVLELEEERAAFAALNTTCRELEADLEDVREKLDDSESENRSTDDLAMSLNKQIDELEAELIRTDDANVRLEKDNNGLKRELADAQARLSRADGRGASSIERLRSRLESKVSEVQARLAKETASKLALQKEVRTLSKEARQYKAEAAEAGKAVKRAEARAAKCDARVVMLRGEVDAQASELALAESERRKLRRVCEEVKESKAALVDECAALKGEISVLRTEREETAAKIAVLTGAA